MDLNDRLLGRESSAGSKVYGIIVNCVLVLLVLVLLAVLLTTNIYALCRVQGDSMNPTLVTTQFVLVEKHRTAIKRGEVIVFKKADNGDTQQFIKRAMAVEGDTFSFVSEGTSVYLHVNGQRQTSDFAMNVSYWRPPYASQISLKLNTEYTVPSGKLLALGDNRNNSKDSRYGEIGYVDTKTDLLGRVDVFLEKDSFLEWVVELIYGVPFKAEYNI